MFHILYGLFCVGFAYANHGWIKIDLRIRHFVNGILHGAVAVWCYLTFGWASAVSALLIARICFDFALNLFRGLPLDYVPKNPKSIADKLEKWVFGNDGLTPKIIYLFLFIVINFL